MRNHYALYTKTPKGKNWKLLLDGETNFARARKTLRKVLTKNKKWMLGRILKNGYIFYQTELKGL